MNGLKCYPKYSLVVQGYKNSIRRIIIDKLLLKDTEFWASSQSGFYERNECHFTVLM